MAKTSLREFIRKEQEFIGLVQLDEEHIDRYTKIRVESRDTNQCVYYPLVWKERDYYEFHMSMEGLGWQHGIYDAFIVTEKEEDETYPPIRLGAHKNSFAIKTGFFSIEAIYYEEKGQVYYPYFTNHSKLSIKVAGRRNGKVKVGNISIQDYRMQDDFLRIKGIQWPEEIERKEAFLVFESKDSSIRYLDQVFANDIFLDFSEIRHAIYSQELHTLWNVFVEINTGDSIYREALTYQDGIQRKEIIEVFEDKEKELIERKEQRHLFMSTSTKGELKLYFDTYDKLLNKATFALLDTFSMKENKLTFAGHVNCYGGEIKGLRLTFRNDPEKLFYDYPVQLGEQKGEESTFSSSIDVAEINFAPYFWDLWVLIEVNGIETLCRVKQLSEKIKRDINRKIIRYTYYVNEDYLVFPYLTGNDNFSLQYREVTKYDNKKYKRKETLAVWIYNIFRFYYKRKNPWLICEKFCQTAQDNSYYFFDYCYHHADKKDIYYIIDKESVEYKKLEDKKDKVIDYMSLKHMIYLQCNAVLVSAETRIHYYAWKVGRGRVREKLNQHPFVFLQHGVIGFKRLTNLGKNSLNKSELFVTSSEFEKKLIMKHIGYEEKEVIVTGLPRWDVVENKVDLTKPREIVIMPSWRIELEGLKDNEFVQSEYYKKYKELVESKELQQLITKEHVKVTFLIHPMLRQYVGQFASNCENITIYPFGETPINEVLMRSSMVITDYSSIAWEVYRMKKPVLFYRFDMEQYEAMQGSYIDLNEEVVGHVTKTVPELLEWITFYIHNGFKEEEQFAKARKKYFAYIDHNNSKRVYEAVVERFKKKKVVEEQEVLIQEKTEE